MKKIISALLAAVLLLALSGCGKKADPFQVLFAAPYVSEELVAAYGETLTQEVKYSPFSIGSEDVDPMAYGASAMAMSAMFAAGEVDVLVCDLEEAARYARSGYFFDPAEIFTEEELEPYKESLLSFEMVDEYGAPTGEQTGPCGLDLSGREDLLFVMGTERCGAFIVVNTEDLELAKEVFLEIVKG